MAQPQNTIEQRAEDGQPGHPDALPDPSGHAAISIGEMGTYPAFLNGPPNCAHACP